MNTEALKAAIKEELPGLLREDPALREFILDLSRREFAGRAATDDRFYELLGELRRDREARERQWEEYKLEQARLREEAMLEQNKRWEAQERKWDEQNRKWEEDNRKWDEQNRKWDEDNRKWEEDNRKWDEDNRKWDEQNRKWDEQNRKWDENQAELKRLHEEIMAQAQKFDRSIGALGARWGLQSEKAFRDALAGILEKSFGVAVLNVNEYDDEGEVFGRPEQVELDVVIKNGMLLICELKSSIDKAGMYIFERKARFYERRHQRQAQRLIVISPMIDARALKVAERLGIETYGDSSEVAA